MKIIKLAKKISSIILTIAIITLCVSCTSFAQDPISASSSENGVELTVLDCSDGDKKIASEIISTEELKKSCLSQISSSALKAIEMSGIVLKSIGTIAVYGGTAKLIADVFYPSYDKYFIIGGMVLGIVSPVARNIYKQLNKTQKEALKKVLEKVITAQIIPKLAK